MLETERLVSESNRPVGETSRLLFPLDRRVIETRRLVWDHDRAGLGDPRLPPRDEPSRVTGRTRS